MIDKQAMIQACVPDEKINLLKIVAQKIACAENVPDVMALVRRAARELTGADGVTLVLRESGKCFYADEDAIGPLWKGQRFPLESCISGWAMLHAQSVVILDVFADQRIPHEAYRSTFVKSLCMVPICREDPIGAIGCYWATFHYASSAEIALQQALADATAAAFLKLLALS